MKNLNIVKPYMAVCMVFDTTMRIMQHAFSLRNDYNVLSHYHIKELEIMNLKGDIIRVNKAKEKEIEQMRQEEKQKQAEELKQKDMGKFGICYDLEV